MVAKLVKDGLVAVLVSPGFGAGWSTWSMENSETMVFDPEIAQAVLDNNHDLALQLHKQKYPDDYEGGVLDLEVEWVPIGTAFRIREYDGSESLVLRDEVNWIIA